LSQYVQIEQGTRGAESILASSVSFLLLPIKNDLIFT